jgi:hypothetical protein
MYTLPQTAAAVTDFPHNTQRNDGVFEREGALDEGVESPPSTLPVSASDRGPRRPLNPKLDAAHRYLDWGIPVFPLVENGKEPALPGDWRLHATTNRKKIERWWTEHPEWNIGVDLHGYVVLDVDVKTKDGLQSLRDFAELHHLMGQELPRTLLVKTWSGGLHAYFRRPPDFPVKNGVDVLGKGLDIKTDNGYVVGAGSVIEGKPYQMLRRHKIAEAPEWFLQECGRPRQSAKNAGERLVPETEEGVALADRWLREHAPEDIPEGERNNGLYKVAAKLYDYGLEYDTVHDRLYAYNAEHVSPPLDEDDVERIARSAERNRQTAIGSRIATFEGFEAVEIDESKAPTLVPAQAPPETDSKPRVLPILTFDESAERALTHAAEPLVEGLLDYGTMSVTYGDSNVGKSFVVMDMAFHIATGMPWAGREVKQGPVAWVAAEGGSGVHKRVAALKKRYQRGNVPLAIVPSAIDLLHGQGDMTALVGAIQRIGTMSGARPVLVVLDTLSRVMGGGDENSSADMGALVRRFDAIRAATGAHVAVIHHSGKNTAKGARGWSGLRAATDTEIEIANDKTGRKLQVTKQRDMDGHAWMRFRLENIHIGVDTRGKPVNSAYVKLRTWVESAEPEPEPLSPDAAAVKTKIDAGLRDRAPGTDSTSGAFRTREVVAWMNGDTQSKTPTPKDLLNRVNRALLEMLKKGWVEKPARGQWVMRNAHDAQNAQT